MAARKEKMICGCKYFSSQVPVAPNKRFTLAPIWHDLPAAVGDDDEYGEADNENGEDDHDHDHHSP